MEGSNNSSAFYLLNIINERLFNHKKKISNDKKFKIISIFYIVPLIFQS